MADAIHWHAVNQVCKPPKGLEEVIQPLPRYTNGSMSVTCWKLTPIEIKEINETGHIFISLACGNHGQPAMIVSTEENVREVMADFGKVWPRYKG